MCTYLDASNQILSKRYVEGLERKVDEMENLLRKMLPPDADLTEELEKEPVGLPDSDADGLIPDLMRSLGRDITNEKDHSVSEDDYDGALECNLWRLQDFTHGRFFGKSSQAQFIQTALDVKHGHPAYFSDVSRLTSRRPQFWDPLIHHIPSRISQVQVNVEYSFPDHDLMWSLIGLYFTQANIFLPVLHRPTFQRLVEELTHLRDPLFATVLLAVCAIASRYSTDPRVLIDNESSSNGWMWMQQILGTRRANSVLSPPLLYDCQSTCLIAEFMMCSSIPQIAWTIAGIGLRVAQEAGAHRKRNHNGSTNAEAESWRRVFWCLLYIDRYISSALGRPCAINDEDIDADLPADCDDEYWDHPDPEQAFKQPDGQPSVISYFNCHMRLSRLQMICLRTIYSMTKSKIVFGLVQKNWEEQIVAELDSVLNMWIDSLPDHLRWDPNRENLVHFKQSAALLEAYYNMQILIHRPFITVPCHLSKWPFPSLAICANAARSCSHVVDIQYQRGGYFPFCGYSAFNAAVVLSFNIWGGQQSSDSIDLKKEIEDVYKCMRILRSLESGWPFAGVLWDILYQLTTVGDPSLSNPVPKNRREQHSDFPFDPNECEKSDLQRDSYAAKNPFDGSSYSSTIELTNTYALSHSGHPSSQWHATSVPLSTKDRQQGPSASVSSQWPRSQAHSLTMSSDEWGQVPLHIEVTSSHHVPEHNRQIHDYHESSSSSPSRQMNNFPGHTPHYRRDGDLFTTETPPVVHFGGSSDDRIDNRTRARWDAISRTMELSD